VLLLGDRISVVVRDRYADNWFVLVCMGIHNAVAIKEKGSLLLLLLLLLFLFLLFLFY
jgi:hypothetical protein